MVILWNSQRDGRKGGKLQQRWLGPYKACVLSADAGEINDTVCQISSVPVCQSVGDIVHTNASQQYSAPMSAVTNRFDQGSISEDKCQSTLCTGDIGS